MNSDKVLAKRVKDYRLSREMTQIQASALFRISLSTYIRVEHGVACSDLVRTKIEKLLNAAQAA